MSSVIRFHVPTSRRSVVPLLVPSAVTVAAGGFLLAVPVPVSPVPRTFAFALGLPRSLRAGVRSCHVLSRRRIRIRHRRQERRGFRQVPTTVLRFRVVHVRTTLVRVEAAPARASGMVRSLAGLRITAVLTLEGARSSFARRLSGHPCQVWGRVRAGDKFPRRRHQGGVGYQREMGIGECVASLNILGGSLVRET